MNSEFQEKLQKYAALAVRTGVNLTKGQEVVVQCSVDHADFCRMVVKEAYEAGARGVFVRWGDDQSGRMRYDYAPVEAFEKWEDWRAESYNYYARTHAALINIISSDPELLKGVDPAKLRAATLASHEATKEFDDIRDKNELQWSIIAVPGEKWAKKVFPELAEKEAVEKLWESIFTACRIDGGDPCAAWKEHGTRLHEKADWLTAQQFSQLHYTNSLGTDFTVGLPEGHRWQGGVANTADGVEFFPNMPTEEVFTLPHADRADGVVKSALPLSYQGALITDFSITFRGGKVVDFSAKEGYDTLKRLLDTDEGSLHLGEVALVPYDSPISNTKVLFYNTLFDENASCHLALGTCYPDCLVGGEALSKEELRKRGGNNSINHVDFMVGTQDLKITGIAKDGAETLIFANGNWA